MRKTLTSLGTLAFGALLGVAATLGVQPVDYTRPAPVDPFSQTTFPCQEDEVLAYAPEFGPDRVGCLHWDTITE